MEILNTALSALLSVAALFILAKIMGEKQISQLSLFDYINGITIGSIAAELATTPDRILPLLAAVTVYALVTTAISILTDRSLTLRAFFTGKPLLLFDNGEFLRENMKKAKLDASDFMTLARLAGYFDLSEVRTAVLEHNGSISFLPMVSDRPATPADLNLTPEQTLFSYGVVSDGRIVSDSLRAVGRDEKWLSEELKKMNVRQSEVMLAEVDKNGRLSVFKKRRI